MKQHTLRINTALQIAKSPSEIAEAILNPDKMRHYFISQSSGRMEEGKEIIWHFPEFEEAAPIKVEKVIEDKFISFLWENGDRETKVEITLEAVDNTATIVRISEGDMEPDEKGMAWLKGNTEGWANFLACLKAYLEFGINLRTGGFDFHRKK